MLQSIPRAAGAVLLVSATLLAATVSGQAQQTLWDQSAHSGANLVNQQFPDLPAYSTYLLADVTFGSAVTIQDITTYVTPFNGASPGSSLPVALSLFTKSGALPTAANTPANLGSAYNATYTVLNGSEATIDLAGLNLQVAAGSYWVGLTPKVGYAASGQTFNYEANVTLGDPSVLINPGGGFGAGTGWAPASKLSPGYGDAAIKIQGTQGSQNSITATPEFGSVFSLGGLLAAGGAGLWFRNRRRK